MATDAQLLAALRRELHELECVAPDTYDVSDFLVPDEVVAATIVLIQDRIAALENGRDVA